MTPTSAPAVPQIAVRLGALAVLPFIVGAVLVWTASAPWRPVASLALSGYAATVLSFIGAIHWGLAFRQPAPAPRLFVWGVVPAIVAAGAVPIVASSGLTLHAVMLVACYIVDRNVYPGEGVAAWLPLRLRLTVCAVICCLAGAAGS